MSDFERGDTAYIVRTGKDEAIKGEVISAGAKWVTVEYVIGGRPTSQQFDATTRCLKNFGDVSKIQTEAEYNADRAPVEYYTYVGDERFTRNGTKAEYRYANAWKDADGNVSVTWHTTLNAANNSYNRRRTPWASREVCLGYLLDVYSAKRTPPSLYDGYQVTISLSAEGQETWKQTFGLGHDRAKLQEDLQSYMEEVITGTLEDLHILGEIPGLRLDVRRP